MIETVVIYLLLFVLWLEPTFGKAVSTGIKGVSLANMAIALIILGWLLSNAFKRQNFQWNNLYKYIIGCWFGLLRCRFLTRRLTVNSGM
jgi:hypothetical protein